MQKLRDMATQLEVALTALKKQIDAADAAKAARMESEAPESEEQA